MNEIYDISRLPSDGYLVFPLSISRLHGDCSPTACYDALEFFFEKIETLGIDVIFLYTNGLYYNNTDTALDVRKKTNEQMLNHSRELKSLIQKKKKFIPRAFHYIPWDFIMLNSNEYSNLLKKLEKRLHGNPEFMGYIQSDLSGRELDDANIRFILEEIVITHIIRQGLVEFPKTLVKNDDWRLIVYPGDYIQSDLYQYKNNMLSTNKKLGKFSHSHYNLDQKKLYDFSQIEL